MTYDPYYGCQVDQHAELSALDRRILDEQNVAAMDREENQNKVCVEAISKKVTNEDSLRETT